MKLAALFLMAIFIQTPDGPATAPDPDYPLHVQVLLTKANAGRYGATGFGRGNILGPPRRGIDFTYECSTPFFNNGPQEFYQARWKKPDAKLEILMQRTGSDKLDKCELAIAYKAAPYASK
jgi:hypothetical protein